MLPYPKIYRDLLKQFPDDKSCRDYLVNLRWPNGPKCSKCQSSRLWKRASRPLLICAECHQQISILAGTIFQDTKVPLQVWFEAIWWRSEEHTSELQSQFHLV